MTKEEFLYYLKRKRDKFDIWLNYATIIVVIGICIFFIWGLDYKKDLFFASFLILLILICINGFWRIPASYKISEHKTKKSFGEIKTIIEDYIKAKHKENSYHYYPNDVDWLAEDNITPTFRYRNKFHSRFDTVVHLNNAENRLYIHVTVAGEGIYGHGYLDFGASKREHKKLDKYLENHL